MKKVIGIFGLSVFAMMVLLANTNTGNTNDYNLNALLNLNSANAESDCYGTKYKVVSTPTEWVCINDAGSSCCPVRQ